MNTIGTGAFYNATALTSVTFEADSVLESIGASAFYGATSLTSITIPDSVTTIGAGAFYGASELKSITFAGNAPSVGSRAFNNVGADLVVNVNFAATGFGTATTWNVRIDKILICWITAYCACFNVVVIFFTYIFPLFN